MRVKRLIMKGFRGIDQMTLEFDDDEPTVLIGINGVGKSSILDCIASLLYRMIEEIRLNSKDYSKDQSYEDLYKGVWSKVVGKG